MTTTSVAMTLDQLKDMLAEYEAKVARNVSNPLIPHGFWSDVVADLRDLIANGGVVVEEALFTLDGQHVANAVVRERQSEFGLRNTTYKQWTWQDADGGYNRVPYAPKRRSTLANKGYTEGEITYAVTVEVWENYHGMQLDIKKVHEISRITDIWEVE